MHTAATRAGRRARFLPAGYAGLAGFVALEALVRRPGSASSLNAGSDDAGTTGLIVAAYTVAVDVPLVTRWLPVRPLPAAAGPAGLALETAGLLLRAWSMRELGASYSRTLRTQGEQQPVVETGPYRLIRHPGYLGSILTWAGFALTARSAPALAVIVALLGGAYRRRILAEERMLNRDLPGYADYAGRTRRLVPFLW